MDSIRYPIGRFEPKKTYSRRQTGDNIARLAELPSRLEKAVFYLSEQQLETQYREDGWTIRQVVHHIIDSHTNGYVRTKWLLTENEPVIKTYDQDKWASLYDSEHAPLILSFDFIRGVHGRWVYLLNGLNDEDFKRVFIHPEKDKRQSLAEVVALYAWHGAHHLAQVQALKEQKGW